MTSFQLNDKPVTVSGPDDAPYSGSFVMSWA